MASTSPALTGLAALLLISGGVQAADLPSRAETPAFAPPPIFSWTGFYVGALVGGGSGISSFADPYGSSIYGDRIHTPLVEGGGQIGYTVQVPGSHVVLGVEADGGAARLAGTNTCIAFSGFYLPANCGVHGNALATGTGRVGYTFGADGRTLAYVKGGVAVLFGNRDITTNSAELYGRPLDATSSGATRVGYTVGAGIEQALSSAWSVKLEYDYMDFASSGIAVPGSVAQVAPPRAGYAPTGRTMTGVRQDIHELKLGLNYHIGAPAGDVGSGFGFFDAPAIAGGRLGAYSIAQGYALEAGGRYWYSSGRFQKDLGGGAGGRTGPADLVSRLTYNDRSNSGEVFGRVDTPANIFVKGFFGAGGTSSGHQNDEDFGIFSGTVPYSNTASEQRGSIDYATVDLGYALLRNADAKVGVFAGYNYDKDRKQAYGCSQIANRYSDCVPALPTSTLGITESDRYDSLRIGGNVDMWLGGGFRIQGDAAYLPYVRFTGLDDHLLRTAEPSTYSPESGHGQGVQLEAIASYFFTPNLSVGVGGRYWAIWIPNATTNGFSSGVIQSLPVQTERYGLLAQASYRFSSAPAAVVAKY